MAARAKRKKKILECLSDTSLSSDDEEVQTNFKGKLFNNKYLCLEYLGKGAFCRVLLVYDIMDDDYYALKIYNSRDNEEAYNEINILKKFSSNNIPKFKDLFSYCDKSVCVVIELLGNSINILLEEYDDKLPINIIKKIIKNTLYGLNDLHMKNILHADLKSDNILIKNLSSDNKYLLENFKNIKKKEEYEILISNYLPDNYSDMNKNMKKKHKKKAKNKALDQYIDFLNLNIKIINNQNVNKNQDLNPNDLEFKLIDFGNSILLNEYDYEYNDIYYRNYRSPEIIIGSCLTTKSDIWCLACIIYELLTGELLFNINKNNTETIKNRKHLLEMFKKLGPISKELSISSEKFNELFDKKGRILRHKNYEYIGFEDKIKELDISNEDKENIIDLLKKMLNYNPIERFDAVKCINHDFFIN